jgi:hypothetical protein
MKLKAFFNLAGEEEQKIILTHSLTDIEIQMLELKRSKHIKKKTVL